MNHDMNLYRQVDEPGHLSGASMFSQQSVPGHLAEAQPFSDSTLPGHLSGAGLGCAPQAGLNGAGMVDHAMSYLKNPICLVGLGLAAYGAYCFAKKQKFI